MPHYSAIIPSSWSVERAFDYMSDFAHAREWDPGVLDAHRLGDDPVGVGSEFDLVVTFAGRRLTLRYRVSEFDPNRRVVFESTTPSLRSVDTLTFTPRAGGCEMTYDADLHFTGAAALANPLLALFFRPVGDRARDSLRERLGR